MDPVLTKLKDFSSKPSRFADGGGRSSQPGSYKRQNCPGIEWDPQGKRQSIDMEEALDWLKSELTEMRFQNQTLVKQLMELHIGIQELKKEYDSDQDLSASESDSEESGNVGSLNHSHPNHGQQAQRENRRNSVP
ncbi:protein FAM167A-like [Heterodontus francisci]|uniref:protein FAM167A-like n=1 Tax=Heterodontus francisci TaxID=7792 RepID=UPI00355BAEAD